MPQALSASFPGTTPSLRRRMASWLYEGILLFGVVFIAGYVFSALSQSRHALTNREPLMVFLFVVLAVYFTWFGHKGQTLAMKTWRIRLVNHLGENISQMQALRRYLFSWVWFLPPLLVIGGFGLKGAETGVILTGWIIVWALLSRFHPQRQFWHDAWAKTRLIEA